MKRRIGDNPAAIAILELPVAAYYDMKWTFRAAALARFHAYVFQIIKHSFAINLYIRGSTLSDLDSQNGN